MAWRVGPWSLLRRALLVSALTGLALGTLGRLAMAALVVVTGGRPAVTVGGSLEVIALGVLIGAPAALVFAWASPRLPGARVVQGVLFGLVLFACLWLVPLPAARSAFADASPELARATPLVFALAFALYGLCLGGATAALLPIERGEKSLPFHRNESK